LYLPGGIWRRHHVLLETSNMAERIGRFTVNAALGFSLENPECGDMAEKAGEEVYGENVDQN